MKILGFNFNKVSVEKIKDNLKDLKINTSFNIEEIKEANSDILKTEDSILAVKFFYTISYEPAVAVLEFKGNLLLSLNPNDAEEVLKQWKNKKMPEEFQFNLFNLIFRKTSARALYLEEEMNLPYHIQLPLLRKQETDKKD